MKIGYIGLGKMGLNMVQKMIETGHTVVTNNRSKEPVDRAVTLGAIPAYSIPELVSKLESPRTIWLMVSSGAVDEVLDQLMPLLNKGDTIIDGGNSHYVESMRRAKRITKKKINFLDVGVSGGPAGARNGACAMVGGSKEIYDKYESLLKDISVQDGYGYMGQSGAGHFVKMVHNGIEYGMMQSIGEGFEIMKKSAFNLDLKKVTDLYNHGSVIESRLIGWLNSAYSKHTSELNGISGEVSHSGEGEWTVKAAKKLKVKADVIKKSLDFRLKSKGNPSYTGQVVSALRNEFGGHDVGSK